MHAKRAGCFALAPAAIAYTAGVAAAPPGGAPPQQMPMQSGMSCGQMMASGSMHAAMTIGWILGVLVALAAIFALAGLGVFLLRRSAGPWARHSTQ